MTTQERISLPTALITGCSAGGIGSALAEALHERGVHVFATARSREKMSHLEKYPNMTFLELDVTSSSDISAAVEAVKAQTGGTLNYLVNNSGVPLVFPALETDLDKAKELYDVNFWGVVAMTHSFAPLLISAKGTVANISSMGGVLSFPWCGFYASSKAAVRAYGEAVRLELAPFGVRVVTVMSGLIGTNIFTRSPEIDLSGSIYEGATKGVSDMATGAVIKDVTPASVYAGRVADDLVGGANGVIWRGKMSSMAWFLSTFLPAWVLDKMLVSGAGLEQLG
ncbi:oxidoreductase [Aspergillus heteromorphus CBS 117.55]|uniref:Oxidoreductase n=1 Tax=Aspergillus heteromorphus CBS 117.55 TaxID=1448321 RepID=A0A317W7M2_9EURO|nr:oxidoreductase [Aspergillus heteromorphus CBS 117.55]PWY82079.1 oxidoreductase [Aspergillus heteromorphus CBS 117.55]